MFYLDPFSILEDRLRQDPKSIVIIFIIEINTQHNISSSMGLQDCIIFPHRFRIL